MGINMHKRSSNVLVPSGDLCNHGLFRLNNSWFHWAASGYSQQKEQRSRGNKEKENRAGAKCWERKWWYHGIWWPERGKRPESVFNRFDPGLTPSPPTMNPPYITTPTDLSTLPYLLLTFSYPFPQYLFNRCLGEEGVKDDQDEESQRTGWYRLQTAKGLCRPFLWGLLHIFNLSLSLERVPVLLKTSCVVPVPKDCTPQGAQPLQTHHLNFAPHQDLVEDWIKSPPTPGELVHGPTEIYISAWN